MKITTKYFRWTTLLFFFAVRFSYSQEISREKAFFYFMNVYGLSPTTNTFSYQMEINKCGKNYLEYYAQIFDHNNYVEQYLKKHNNEFENYGMDYWEKLNSKMLEKIKNIKFADKFTITTEASFSAYSFSNNSFPLNVSNNIINSDFFYDGECYCQVYIGNIINITNFTDLFLKMPPTDAKNFAEKRKDSNGNINRNVYERLTYSIVNKKTSEKINYASNILGSNILIYAHSIEIFEDASLTKKLGVFYPKESEKGQNELTVYFSDRDRGYWSSLGASVYKLGQLPSKEGAKYYRVYHYEDGVITNIKDYYISGKLEMEGSYSVDCATQKILEGTYSSKWYECANGIFTWYYENGYKRQEVPLFNGKMEGCVHMWEEDGKCRGWGYSNLMSNDNSQGENNQCPCINQTEKRN